MYLSIFVMSEYGMIFKRSGQRTKILCVYFVYCCVIPYVYGQSNETLSEENSINSDSSNPVSVSESCLGEKEIFDRLKEKGLYYDLETIMDDINANKLKTGIIDLMSVHNRSEWISTMRQSYQSKDQIKKKKRMIFINVETVYSSKREMITKALSRRMRGKQMTSPPKFMADIRVIVGPGTARKLFYSLTKYSTAHHIQQALTTQAVVLEKYWLHHAAFIISKEFNETKLPPRGHAIYRWPKDLLVPDVLFFVNATKTIGEATGFYQPYTPFTDRLIQVYRRIEGINIVELNPHKNFNTIVRQIIEYITQNFSNHPDIMVPWVNGTVARDSPRARRRRH